MYRTWKVFTRRVRGKRVTRPGHGCPRVLPSTMDQVKAATMPYLSEIRNKKEYFFGEKIVGRRISHIWKPLAALGCHFSPIYDTLFKRLS